MKQKFFKNFILVDMEFYKIIHRALRKKYAFRFDDKFFDTLSKQNSKFAKILQEKSTKGLCYGYALLLANFIPNCTLIHGVLANLPCICENGGSYYEFEHAWVETKNLVFDTSAKCVFDKNEYYKLFAAKANKIFTKADLSNEVTLKNLSLHAINLRPEMSGIFGMFEPFSKFAETKPQTILTSLTK